MAGITRSANQRRSQDDQEQDYDATIDLAEMDSEASSQYYSVERALAKRQGEHGIDEYLCLWEGYPQEDASWTPYVTDAVVQAYHHPPSSGYRNIQYYAEQFCTAVDKLLRAGSSKGFLSRIEFRHDVYRYLFGNKFSLDLADFDGQYFKQWLCKLWHLEKKVVDSGTHFYC